jgi:hypothetical protein
MHRALSLGVVLASLFLASIPASAQQGASSADRQVQARAKAQEGYKLYSADRWEEALAMFREGEALYHAPSILVFVARCQRKLGKLLDARNTYLRILSEDLPKDAPPAFVSAHVDAGKELELLRQRTPSLEIAGVPAEGARITVNGAPAPADRRDLDPGSYTIEVSAPGSVPFKQTIQLAEGSHERVTVELHAQSAPAAPPAPNRVPAFVAFGVGGFGFVVGGVLGGVALVEANKVKSLCGENPSCGGSSTSTEAHDRRNLTMRLAWGSNAGLILGAAGAITGVVLLVTARSPAARQTAQRALGSGGLTLRF